MWAFAIWQRHARKLFFARDRFGVKPLYYHYRRPVFCMASEPKAILKLFPECRRVAERTLAEFLAWGRLYASGSSFYRGVESLPPAHCGEFALDDAALRTWRYWDYPTSQTGSVDLETATEEFSELIEDAVRIRLRSDVPVGVTLSGGLDSTAILTASMKASGSPRPCFTAVYEGHDRGEAAWAQIAAAPYGIRPIEVPAPGGDWIALMREISWHMDGPGYSPAVFPLWNIMAQARKLDVPVLLEGQGADESLAGYPQYMALAILASLKPRALFGEATMRLPALIRGALDTFSTRWTALWLLRELFPGATGFYRARVGAGSTLRPEYRLPLRSPDEASSAGSHGDPVNDRLWSDHARHILPGLLHYGDAISMAHSVESRLPFLDFRVVEWLFRQPAEVKLAEGRTKYVLRRYLSAAGQSEIAARRDKQGFPTPAERWLAADNGAIAREMLLAADSRVHEFCSPAGIQRLIEHHAAGKAGAGNHLYRLLSTEMWMRRCLA
jgi:asparagine synthase (glutamine-hydrolysing)